MSFVLCGSPPGSHNSSFSSSDVWYPSISMDETSIASPSQDLSSFMAFLRMPLSEGEVEDGLESGHVIDSCDTIDCRTTCLLTHWSLE